MTRHTLATLGITNIAVLLTVGFTVAIAPIQARGQGSRLEFEAASVRPNTSGSGGYELGDNNGRVAIENATLQQIIEHTYDVKHYQISGPDWLTSDRFDIAAVSPDGTADSQIAAMMQALLADRFKMVVRRERKEVPIYALVVTADGPKMTFLGDGPLNVSTGAGGASRPSTPGLSISRGAGSMEAFADSLSERVDRPVIDRTGLSGRYSRTLEYRRDNAPPEVVGPSIFTALEEQLGLRLEPSTGPIEYLVIEHVERPAEN